MVELQCAADELRAPETEPERPPYALSPRFEFGRERLYFLTRANNYDDRVGRMVWGPDRRGAAARRDRRRRLADVLLADGTPAWCDGGPRTGTPSVPDGHVLVHRNNLEQRVLGADRSVTSSAELAADQLAAVVHDAGAARVIAPAGSGKTRVLTERFRLLVDRGWSPGSITAVAYNVRAKDTMRDRLADMPEGARRRVRTLHALGNDVLGRGMGNSALIDEWEMRRRIEALVPVKPRANTDMYAPYLEALERGTARARRPQRGRGAARRRRRVRRDVRGVPRQAARRSGHRPRRADLRRDRGTAPDARRAAQRSNAKPATSSSTSSRTSRRRSCCLLRLVAAPAYDVFGVGDDDQVIYGYAGADPEFLINYDRYFPGGTHHALATNYRCPEPVVTATRNLLSYNRRRIDKEIVAAKAGGGADARADALSIVTADPERVAGAAVERVTAWLEAGAQPHEIAVLSRVNSVLLPRATPARRSRRAVVDAGERRRAQPHRHAHRARVSPARARGREQHRLPRRRPRARGPAPEPIAAARGACSGSSASARWTTAQLRREPDALTGTAAAKFDAFCDDLDALGRAFDGGATTARLLTLIRDDVGLGAALATLDLSGKAPDASHRDDLNALISVATFEPDPGFVRTLVARPAARAQRACRRATVSRSRPCTG